MRRPIAAVLSALLALSFSLLTLDSATAVAPRAKPKESTKVVTAPIDIYKAAAAQTPGGPLDYCAVTVFVVFPEIAGYQANRVTWVANGATTESSESMQTPFDDAWTWGPLSRNAPAGEHQHMMSGQPSVWSAGSADCEEPYRKTVAAWPTTARVTYQAVEKCASAIDGYNAADKALSSAKRKFDKAKTPALKSAAAAKVRTAKAAFAKAKKAYNKRC